MVAEIFGLAELPEIPRRFNVAPTQMVPVVRQEADGSNRIDVLRWGLIPSWAKDPSIGSRMINARSETAAEKPAFRLAARHRRCAVLASGFYEWMTEGKVKLPLYIHLKSGAPLVFAGLWEIWNSPEGEVESCAMLTTVANPLIARLHDRMPVILHLDEIRLWLDRQVTDPSALGRFFQPYPADLMEMWRVLPLVNSVRNESAELVVPVGEGGIQG